MRWSFFSCAAELVPWPDFLRICYQLTNQRLLNLPLEETQAVELLTDGYIAEVSD